MKEIISLKGERYSFDDSTGRIFKDGFLLPSSMVEPVYSVLGKSGFPRFAGILLKGINSILSLSGKINPVSDENLID